MVQLPLGRIARMFAGSFICTMGLTACEDTTCGPNQVYEKDRQVCSCVEGTVFSTEERACVVKEEKDPDPPSDAGTQPDMVMNGCDPESGLGCPCTGDADCEGKAADYCVIPDPADPEMKRACLLQGCDMPGKECPAGLQCCDFFLAPEGSVCLPAEDFECPFG